MIAHPTVCYIISLTTLPKDVLYKIFTSPYTKEYPIHDWYIESIYTSRQNLANLLEYKTNHQCLSHGSSPPQIQSTGATQLVLEIHKNLFICKEGGFLCELKESPSSKIHILKFIIYKNNVEIME